MALNLVCAVLDRGPENLAEMAVLLAIADSADKDTGEAWPSQKTIARRSRQTDRSVRNVLSRLKAAGWLTWEERKRANGSRASSLYIVNLEKLGETPRNHVPTPRNDVPPPPEPRSTHAPEPRSALEPSQKKEPTRARKTGRSPEAPAASALPCDRQAEATGAVDVESLNDFQRSCLRQGKPVLIGGAMLQPGQQAFEAAKAAEKERTRAERSAAYEARNAAVQRQGEREAA